MNEIFFMYSSLYTVIVFSFVYKTDFFVSIGWTIENLFESYLGREQDNFVMYHIKRTCIAKILYLSIPFGYFIGLCILKAQKSFVLLLGNLAWQFILVGSILIPIYAFFNLFIQYQHGWNYHPVVKKLKLFKNDQNKSWLSVCNEINSEYKQLNKVIFHCGNRLKVVITRNWIIKAGTYDLEFANQNNARLIVYSADTHDSSSYGYSSVIQFINVKVIYFNNTQEFTFRMQAYDFKDLKEALHCPLTVSKNVTFYETKRDEFLQIFKEFVNNNPPYFLQNEEIEMCIGCLVSEANVKLVKKCVDRSISNNPVDELVQPLCVSCKCRPLWCVDCLGKWFVSKQNQSMPETWLSSKCSCPVCRSTFCILDVLPIASKE